MAPEALAEAPVVVVDRKDDLQHRYLRERLRGSGRPLASHVPATADFLTAIRLGLGWGMLPDVQCPAGAGGLVELDPAGAIDVTLHWPQWKLRPPSLDRVAAAVVAAAGRHLAP